MRQWWRGLIGWAGRSGEQMVALVSPWLANVVWTINRTFLLLAREGYARNSVVYACLRLLSQSVPEAPLLAERVDGAGGRAPLPHDHPLCRLIRRPNALQTEYGFWELTVLGLGICGRMHWFKQRDRAGRVAALWPLRPDRVSPIYAPVPRLVGVPTSAPYGFEAPSPPGAWAGEAPAPPSTPSAPDTPHPSPVLWGWAYWPPGQGAPARIPRAEVATFLFPDPGAESGGLAEGLGPLQVLAREVEVDTEATTFLGSLLKNSAVPGSLLKLKGRVRPEVAEKVKRIFQVEFGGLRRGEPAILDGDAEFQQVGFNLRDLEFPSLRDVAESRIAAAFGVPAILVGLKVGLESGIRATIEEQREYFAETTLCNYWRRLADTFTSDVAAEFGEGLVCRFDLSQVRALADQQRAQAQPLYLAYRAGAVTRDEYRRALGLPPLQADGNQAVPR